VNFSRVSQEEALRRAREIVPTLRERAQMELPFVAVVDIVAELARGCPSTRLSLQESG